MGFGNNDIMKLCSFYVSDWHLVTMLLPYISKKVNEEADIVTILENDIQPNIEKLVEKLNLKNTKEILNIDWNKINENKKIINNIKNNTKKEIVIIINGSKEFIKKYNVKLDRFLNTHIINSKIKIVNCYDITNFDGKISNILNVHDKVLNTSGEKNKEDIFKQYEEKQNEKKVI